MTELPPLSYPDSFLRSTLQNVRTIAVVGASSNPERASHEVMKYLQDKGYRCIPVNPGLAGQTLLGETVYADLKSIPFPVDMVDIFRNAEAAGARVLPQPIPTLMALASKAMKTVAYRL